MRTKLTLDLLQRFESRNVTFVEPDGSWPIVWRQARGVHVWDAEGRKYVDLTAAFGVAAAGHANPAVIKAAKAQMERLLHAMGDVHPHEQKALLTRELSRVTFERWQPGAGVTGKTILCNSGFEAVEAALKTALLATGKSGVLAFEGGYHGLGYGALNATHRPYFSRPFRKQLGGFGSYLPFPTNDASMTKVRLELPRLIKAKRIGAILVEPVQARGGINLPHPDFLPLLRQICDQTGALLILDEIYTGFGRTGQWFACEHWNVVPDMICLGKALTGGFPLSALVGRSTLMDQAWPVSHGEALHTSTFLGHPVGCAMALAQIREIRRQRLAEKSRGLGPYLIKLLQTEIGASEKVRSIRGIGLMVGIELKNLGNRTATSLAIAAMKSMLKQRFILLPEGDSSSVISFTPPLIISKEQLRSAVGALREVLE